MKSRRNKSPEKPAWIISITPKDFAAQREIEKQLTSAGITYQLHSTTGIFCIWCGIPISMVNDMKVYNDGRILWLTRHCNKEYIVALNLTNLDQATDLPAMLKETVRQAVSPRQSHTNQVERVENAERPL
jgi:hypothetical protein